MWWHFFESYTIYCGMWLRKKFQPVSMVAYLEGAIWRILRISSVMSCSVSRRSMCLQIASQTVCLPVFPEMTEEQVRYVIETVNGFYKEK